MLCLSTFLPPHLCLRQFLRVVPQQQAQVQTPQPAAPWLESQNQNPRFESPRVSLLSALVLSWSLTCFPLLWVCKEAAGKGQSLHSTANRTSLQTAGWFATVNLQVHHLRFLPRSLLCLK